MKNSKTIFYGFVLISAGCAFIFDPSLGLAINLFLVALFKLIQWLRGRRSTVLDESLDK